MRAMVKDESAWSFLSPSSGFLYPPPSVRPFVCSTPNLNFITHIIKVIELLYVRHYNLRFVYFKPTFWSPKLVF